MKTKIIFCSLIMIGLVSCSNQPADEKTEKAKIENPANSSSTTFTIVSSQDTTTKDGESIIKYSSGNVKMHGMMKAGKREGLWKSFYENGLKWSETTFEAGIKNGRTSTWYENGKKRYDGFFTNDIESGKWTYWNEAGELVDTKDFDLPQAGKK